MPTGTDFRVCVLRRASACADLTARQFGIPLATLANFFTVRIAKIDTNSFNVTMAQPLSHDPALGKTVDGGLTKLGTGTLTFSGTSTFTAAPS